MTHTLPATNSPATTLPAMHALAEIKSRFKPVLDSLVDDSGDLLSMIRPARGDGFGDYQVNCAMPLKAQLNRPPREIAAELVEQVQLDDLCDNVEVAGPGFINLTLNNRWLQQRLATAFTDERLGVAPVEHPRTIVVDFSSPNVAKPMHVGHIRSTVIGDALARILRFVGHKVITDNHLGDWGTQFGMIIYGYKNFVEPENWQKSPIAELGRLYKFVRRLMDFHAARKQLPEAKELLEKQQTALARVEQETITADKKAAKKLKKDRQSLTEKISDQHDLIESLEAKISSIKADSQLLSTAEAHADIGNKVLEETAALHSGDEENLKLWNEFLPFCKADIHRIYQRLGVQFDHELGESFYHSQLADVVDDFEKQQLATKSEGAICVFLDDFEAPMLIQKKDGAFLYATSDLATIKYRMEQWNADEVLYVVDHRQHEHFDKLFAAAAKWGFDEADFHHVSFGTVLGDDGKPFKTRSGDTVGLEELLDEAESRARSIAAELAAEQQTGFSDEELNEIGRVVGIGGLKYVDLSQNRSSDYKFSYEKMLALKGNTATYLQYSYARVQGILRKGGIESTALRDDATEFRFADPVERKLALGLVRFPEALDEVLIEYKPNLLATYLFELTQVFFQFYAQCQVLDVVDEQLCASRLKFCDLTARTIRTGLSLLGIEVVDRM